MGVDTKAIIKKDATLEQIEKHLSKKYVDVTVHNTHSDTYFKISFKDGEDSRAMNIHFGKIVVSDYDISGVLLSLGRWGKSKEIMMHMLDEFGGYFMYNDCKDDFSPVNIEAYNQAKDITPKDQLVNEIIHHLGYTKLKQALNIFDKYKNIEL